MTNILNKKNKNYGDKEAILIAEDIKKIHHPTSIDLSHNNIRNKGAKFLANALKGLSVNVTIDLSYNHIDEDGFKYFEEVIKEISSPPFFTINLTNNEIDRLDNIITNSIDIDSEYQKILRNDSAAICMSHDMAKLFQHNIYKISDKLGNTENMLDICIKFSEQDGLRCGVLELYNSNYCGTLHTEQTKWLQYDYFITYVVANIVESTNNIIFKGFDYLLSNIFSYSDDSWTASLITATASVVGMIGVVKCCGYFNLPEEQVEGF